jgi:hypothetical protein
MIDLSQSASASPLLHSVPTDPGTIWVEDADVVIEAPPDAEVDPQPDAQWPTQAERSGIYGIVTPRVVALPGNGYRMYYTQIMPRAGFSEGANDYCNSTTRILSAISADGMTWTPEPGLRLSAADGGAGECRREGSPPAARVVCGDIVPVPGTAGKLRMYYECCNGTQKVSNSLRSAVSGDGLEWTLEPGDRISDGRSNFAAPRIIFLDDGRCRLYYCERSRGILSALSDDGLSFEAEPGMRIKGEAPGFHTIAFAPEIMKVDNAGYVMYFAGYNGTDQAGIFRAESEDGLVWEERSEPVISPDDGKWGAAKCSEMCVIRLPCTPGEPQRYRIVYEACDGTARDQRGVWRIAGSTSPA